MPAAKVPLVKVRGMASTLVTLYESGIAMKDIADRFGFSYNATRNVIRENSKTRTQREAMLVSQKHRAYADSMRGVKRAPFPPEWRSNISASRLAFVEINARGVSLKPSGYVEFTLGANKFRSEHRVMAERMIGRPLLRSEHVHHIDGNRTNNDPSNLVVMSAADHARLHRKQELARGAKLHERLNNRRANG